MAESDKQPIVKFSQSGQESTVMITESRQETFVTSDHNPAESSQQPAESVMKSAESDHASAEIGQEVTKSCQELTELDQDLTESGQKPAESSQEPILKMSVSAQNTVVKRGPGRPKSAKSKRARVVRKPSEAAAEMEPSQAPVVRKRSSKKKKSSQASGGIKRGPGRPRGARTRRDEDWEPSYSHNTLRPTRQLKKREKLEISLQSDLKWTRAQKEKLLEALYRHSPSAVESISSVVGDKTPQQVEQFINKMVNSSFFHADKRKTRVDPEHGLAPLELWLTLVQGLVKPDSREDHSFQYAKVFQVISRNEPIPEESGFHGVSWKNLYGYVTDLLNDKAVLTPLTSMEALVMLDMIHTLNDTLHSSDTQEQRRLLDLKYQLFKLQSTDGPSDLTAGISSHNNDFSKVTYTLKSQNDSTAQASVSSSTSTTSAPVTSLVTSTSSATLTSLSSSVLSTAYTLPGSHQAMAANQNSAICVSHQLPTAANGSNHHVSSSLVRPIVQSESPSTSTSNSAPTFKPLSTEPFSTSNVRLSNHHDSEAAQTLATRSPETTSTPNSAPTFQPFSSKPVTDVRAMDCNNSTPITASSEATSTTAPPVVSCSAALSLSSGDAGKEQAKNGPRSQPSSSKLSDEESEEDDDDKFTYSNFFTLNPLTIPAHFLSLNRKPEEGEIVINFK